MTTQQQPPGRPGRPGRRWARHALAGAVAALLLVVGTGILSRVGDADRAPAPPSPGPATSGAPSVPEPGGLGPTDLLGVAEIERLEPERTWHVARTDDNTAGSGLNTLCQGERFADPHGTAALVRTFYATGAPRRGAVESVEVSASRQAAGRAYRAVLGWYAGCRVGRLQLVDSFAVGRVGDRATVMTLRRSERPVTSVGVAVARVGTVTTSVVTTTVGGPPPSPRLLATTLAGAVARVCPVAGRTG
ncbi:MAG: hypothetical protein WB441_08045, partial [Nocardioidaceae bacterium]